MAAINCDLTDVAPSTGFDAIPAGKYKVIITSSENKPNSKNTGSYLQLVFEVIEGPHEKRKLYARLNLDNPSDQAVGIARAELKAICVAVNVTNLKDSEQLHDIPLVVRVAEVKDKTDPSIIRNEIKGYESVNAAKTTPATKPATTGTGSAPWKKQG